MPTPQEIAYFVDMQTFNGGGFEKFEISYPKSKDEIDSMSEKAIDYLRIANEEFLLHKIASRKNSALLNPENLSDSDRALFSLSYDVSLKLNGKHSRQFKLTTINRRAAILFGKAYYSDKDKVPVEISFSK